MAEKRKGESTQLVAHKRAGEEARSAAESNKAALTFSSTGKAVYRAIKRTSNLSQPIMQFTGHQGAVLSLQFNSSNGGGGGVENSQGNDLLLASTGVDKTILLWKCYGEVENYGIMQGGHTGPILQLLWSRDSSQLFSCSADASVAIWDIQSGTRIKKFRGHQGIVNSISVSRRGQEMISSVADDGLIKVWDCRIKDAVKTFRAGGSGNFPLLATAFSRDGGIVYSAGIAEVIEAWDLRRDAVIYTLKGHEDSVTGLKLSPSGDLLLSNSMDNTVRSWDVRPFAIGGENRLERKFEGAIHGYEKNLIRPCWSPDGDYIACGSGDRSVVIWDALSGKMQYKLPGHKGVVNEVDWSGAVVASASSDQTIFVGELDLSEI